MVSLEDALFKFEGNIVGGRGKIYKPSNTKNFAVMYAPQVLIESNMAGTRNEFDFDACYNLSGLHIIHGENATDLGPYIKALLTKLESLHLLYDPRYLYEHNKDRIIKSSSDTYSLEISYDLGSPLPATKLRVDFILNEDSLSSMRILSIDQTGNENIHSEVDFDYSHPWLPQVLPPEDKEPQEEPELDLDVDPANAWMQ